jgi:hypothetical protein
VTNGLKGLGKLVGFEILRFQDIHVAAEFNLIGCLVIASPMKPNRPPEHVGELLFRNTQ